MSTSLKLPPTERDFEIYDAIHIACSSTRCQAELHRISQTRVRQIVRRVVEWLGEVLPPQTKVAKEQETHLARQIAADRFQRQLEQITTFWDMTQDAKYASIRIRLTTAQARLGVVGGLIDGLAADAIEGIPIPVWTSTREGEAPAEPAVGWDKAAAADVPPSPDADSSDPNPKSENPKSLFPPPHLVAKGLKALRKNMPHELGDPFRWKEITPEIVAARAAWGWPFPPVLIQNLQKCGILPSDDAPAPTPPPDSHSPEVGRGSPDPALSPTLPLSPSPTPDSPVSQSEISNLKSEISSPPLLGDCSPSDEFQADDHAATENPSAVTDSASPLSDQDRFTAEHELPGLNFIEKRLLTLLENTPANDTERRESLEQTLSTIRLSKAAVELRISPNVEGAALIADPPTLTPLPPTTAASTP